MGFPGNLGGDLLVETGCSASGGFRIHGLSKLKVTGAKSEKPLVRSTVLTFSVKLACSSIRV